MPAMNIAERKQLFIEAREAYRAALQAELNSLAEVPRPGKSTTIAKKKMGRPAGLNHLKPDDILPHIPKDRASAVNFWGIAKASGIKPKQANLLLKKFVKDGKAVMVANGPATKYYLA